MRLISKKDHLASKKSNCVVAAVTNVLQRKRVVLLPSFEASFCAMPHWTYYQSLTTFIGHVFDRVTPRNLINWTNTASVFLYPIQFYNLWVAALTPKEFRFQFSWWKKMQPNFMHGWAHFLLDSISLATDKKFEAFSGLAIKIQAKAAAGAEKQSNEKTKRSSF